MRETTTLIDLILKAIVDGYDVTITVRATRDGAPGVLNLPSAWAEKIGVDVDAMRRLAVDRPQ